MKRYSTHLLRAALLVMGGFIIFLCVLLFPAFIYESNRDYLLLVAGLYVAALPFFYALYQAWKLLSYIDHKMAFSTDSVGALRAVKRSAIAITALFLAYSPIFMERAQAEDAPGLFAICLMIAFMSGVIAVFTALLEGLFQSALDIKSENDMTV